MTAHLPPQNLEAEEAVLGAMLMSTAAIEAAGDLGLTARDFYRPSHRVIFAALLELHDRDAVDELTLCNLLKGRPSPDKGAADALEAVGGQVAVLELVERVPAVANARAYIADVIETAARRRIVDTGHQIAQLGYGLGDAPASDLVARAAELVADAAATDAEDGFVALDDLLGPLYDLWAERAESGGAPVGLQSGWRDVDRLTSGFHPGQFSVVGARPGVGKTAFAMGIVEHLALHDGAHVAVFNLEMSPQELAGRTVSSMARVDGTRLRSTAPADGDWPAIVSAIERIATHAPRRVLIDQATSLTTFQLRNRCRRLHRELARHGNSLGMVVVDYLQLLKAAGRFNNRQEEVAFMARDLKLLARELGAPVVALSQLNRASELRTDKRPTLGDLRESGAIEQDADLVMLLHRPEMYDQDNPEIQGKAEVIVPKNRHGAIGSVWLTYLSRYTRFESIQREVIV